MKKGLVCLLLVFMGLGIFADESGVEEFVRRHKVALDGGRENGYVFIVNAGTMLQGKMLVIDNVEYGLAYNEGKLSYVETCDPDFLTGEGLSVKSTVAECLMKGHSVEAEPGVGLFMNLKDGWRVYLSDGSESLHLADTVKYFCIIDERLSNSVDLQSWVEHIQNSIPCDEQDAVQEGKVRFVPIPCEKWSE
ncbi:MAG: hypothetical protein II070_01410 [Treponema sp.]|nr:hypothetical protein [Treponema sp.]